MCTSECDEAAAVWVATGDAVPGLANEAATAEELVAKLLMAAGCRFSGAVKGQHEI